MWIEGSSQCCNFIVGKKMTDEEMFLEKEKIFRKKKNIIFALFKSLLQYPTTDEERELIIKRAIRRNEFPSYKGDLENLKWDNYFITVTIGVICNILQMQTLGLLIEKKRVVSTKEMPNLPQDGSRGQWRVAQKIELNTINWFLGEENEI